MNDPLQQFRDAMAKRAIIPPANLVADGKLHRCDAAGKNGKGDASYLLHLDGIPAGGFENWRDGIGWQTWRANNGQRIGNMEAETLRRRIETQKQNREAERTKLRAQAASKAAGWWQAAMPANPAHDYLRRKMIDPHNLRQRGDMLLVPLLLDGLIVNLQTIAPDGTKRFLSGGLVAGCYGLLGEVASSATIYLCEGFATGATIREVTGKSVACAMYAGNLLEAGHRLLKRHPNARLIIAGDDDRLKPGNPGRSAATAAATALHCGLVMPQWPSNAPISLSDFNDLRAWEVQA